MSLRLNMARMGISHFTITIVSALTMIIITRHYGPVQYGAFTMAGAVVGSIAMLAGMGMQFILIRELALSFATAQAMLAASLVVVGANSVISAIVLCVLSAFLQFDIGMSCWLLANSVALSAATCLWSMFRAREQFRQEAVVEALRVILYMAVVCILVFVLKSSSIRDAVTSQFAINAAALAVIFGMVKLVFGREFAAIYMFKSIEWDRVAFIYKSGIYMMCITVGVVFYSKIAVVMIGQMMGNHAVGTFGASYRIFETTTAATTVLLGVMYPRLVKQAPDRAKFHRLVKRIILGMVVIGVAVGLVMQWISSPLIITLLGPKFAPGVQVLQILGWGIGLNAIGSLMGMIFRIFHIEVWFAMITAGGGIVNVAFNLALIPKCGTTGAAWGIVLSLAFVVTACLLMLSRRLKAAASDGRPFESPI